MQRMRGMGLHSAVLLLTNDHGLCVRAQVNGIKCYSAHEMPRDSQVLVKVGGGCRCGQQAQLWNSVPAEHMLRMRVRWVMSGRLAPEPQLLATVGARRRCK